MDRQLQQLYGAVGGALAWARNPERKRNDARTGAEVGVERHYAGSMKAWSLAMHARKRKKKLALNDGSRPKAATDRMKPLEVESNGKSDFT